jgi:hypothetical protein
MYAYVIKMRVYERIIIDLNHGRGDVLIPGEAAHHNEMIAPTVTE